MGSLLKDISDLGTWCQEAERVDIGYNWAEYGQESGLSIPEDKTNIQIFSKQQEQLSRLLLSLMDSEIIPRERIPDVLFFDVVEKQQRSVTAGMLDKIREVRNKERNISRQNVSVNSLRKFNNLNLKEPLLRDSVFNGLIDEVYPELKPLEQNFFDSLRDSYASRGLNVLGVYCTQSGTTPEKLKEVVDRSGRLAKKRFMEMANVLWPKILGHSPISCDDYYVWRPVVFSEFDHVFQGSDPLKCFLEIAEKLEMKEFFRYVTIDDKQRQGKHPSPVFFYIDVPRTGKMLFQRSKPFEDATSSFHEGGHSLHFSAIDPKAPYWSRYICHTSIAEIPSTLFESIATDPTFLRDRLGVKQETIEAIKERERFFEHFYLTFYAANAMAKIEMWEKNLNVDQVTDRYEELTGKYGMQLPGGYWLIHHVMPMYGLYSPSYLLAKIRMSGLQSKLKNEFGEKWYDEPKAGKYLREEVFKPGSAVNLDSFSSLDSDAYFKEFGLV